MKNLKSRAMLYELAGAYLLFLAYQLFDNRAESNGGDHTIAIVFMILFVLFGIGIIGMGLRMMYKSRKIEKTSADQIAQDHSTEEDAPDHDRT